MNKLIAELRRLYFLPEQPFQNLDEGSAPVAIKLAEQGGMVRIMVVGFERAVDWGHAAMLYQAGQEDLELPAPAVSVSGGEGYQLWFSLTEPVPAERARLFLNALYRTYLREVRPAHLKFWPDVDASLSAEPSLLSFPPALHETSGKWSAFIDPGMGSMFIEEPGLGMAPTMDRQADLLAGLKSIKANVFERALNILQTRSEATTSPSELVAADSQESGDPVAPIRSTLNVGSNFADPKSFLLAVMNDSSVTVDHRIEAARALLPYFLKMLRTSKRQALPRNQIPEK